MASLTEIREGIVNVLREHFDELNLYDRMQDVIEVPAAVVLPETADYTGAFQRGMDEWMIDVFLFVQRVETGWAQAELDKYVTGGGEKSIRKALHQNASLGLSDGTDCTVVGLKDYGAEYENARAPHVGARLRLKVITFDE